MILAMTILYMLVGFKSRTHFMAAFRRKFGKTPSSYRAHFQPDRQK